MTEGHGMENGAYLPNPLTSPALMVLASTAEASRETPSQASGPPHPAYPQNLEKKPDPAHTTPNTYGVYQRGDGPYPPPMYAHMHGPFARPPMGLINPGGGGAFRPVLSPEDRESYHSAFTPAKRSRLEEIPSSPGKTDDDGGKDGQLSSPGGSASAYDIETRSEGGDSIDRGTPDSEGRTLRKRKKSGVFIDGATVCPACGLSLRVGEIQSHYALEIERLERSNSRKGASRESTPLGRKNVPLTPSSGRRGTPSLEAVAQSRFESYLRVKLNRQSRLNAKNRIKRRKQEESACPVCDEKMVGSPEELNSHVEHCLKRRGGCDIAGPVDVEGDDEQYEEYTWAGQTRVRATSMVPGGLLGYASSSKEEDSGVLNVDDDDNDLYGKPQYSEVNIIPTIEDEPSEEKARQALRGAVLKATGDQMSPTTSMAENSKWESSMVNGLSNSNEGSPENKNDSSPKSKLSPGKRAPNSPPRNKCLICMEQYTNPLTSIQCWHVHCEECWLRTLALYTVQEAPSIDDITVLCTVYGALCTDDEALYTVYGALCTDDVALYTVDRALCTVDVVLCTASIAAIQFMEHYVQFQHCTDDVALCTDDVALCTDEVSL
ncbi:unnamed protein product [Owenia fusiformis]|uniref:Uncharacterized protein n=1 Tax=Owenia fusiformis TaxID=6347 RepID=A0A8S4MXK4_OWEFU|nr:unnamed protein product [Owenia fusiformis]